MTGTTGVRELRVDCIVGIYAHEREREQTVLLNIEIDYDFAPAHASDAIGDVVDYDMAVSAATALIRDRQFHLIETMAEEVAALLLDRVTQANASAAEDGSASACAATWAWCARADSPPMSMR